MTQDLGSVADSGTSHYVDLPAGRFHYRRWTPHAPASSAVLVHGNGGTWATWARVGAALGAAGMDVLAVDLRGNGASVRPPAGSYGLREVAGDLDDFLRAVRVHAPLLIGHCWGGAAALALATGAVTDRVPPVLSGLVLEELPPDMAATATQPVVRDFLRMMRSSQEYVAKWVDLVCRDWHPVDRESLLEETREADVQVYFSTIDDGAAAGPLLPLLAQVKVPALVLRGDPRRGGMLSDADWQLAREYLPGHCVAGELPGSGHELHRGDFAGFMRLVRKFLATMA
ncbi:alpha/beta fold hydrolase [Microtetraspora malaysiensis]|uniref:alpha/beta fold hydrolase n=1 Tax=Microtetraspora malaysiensis TaxID=161358 RepID=UPI003D8B32B5